MLKNYPFTIRVKSYNEDFTCIGSENILVYANSYKECAEWLEEYYGSCLVSFDIKLINDEPLFLSDKLIAAIEEEVDY